MKSGIPVGMPVQWPPAARLPNRYGRVWLIGRGRMLLALVALPLAVLPEPPLWLRKPAAL
ncbi:MAG: hypothetical protein CRU78_17940 [Candidatus Accumulibacter phosphatis]|uniref:Uncharacterized protein n=1 Tax=Candidatus Accumulibacter phosphatis TaxID=327160 RepID=A0A6A7RXR4_9PROT|nr:hypothetical protein [Candidatus Accumulibacter phosphatis]